MNLRKIIVSNDNTHHLFNEKPLYAKKFKRVFKFHPPGLAPVLDESGAYHIELDGNEAYKERFIKTFGYYFDKAAIITKEGWGHIDIKGNLVYEPIYDWVGNYQDEVCTVRDKKGSYFHIKDNGDRVYSANMLYAGDFRNEIAVVRKNNGLCTHIYKDGTSVHGKYFIDLDVFHKGFARAKNKEGWFHINEEGKEIYQEKYKCNEPFYNGYALVENMLGNRLIIDEGGNYVHTVIELSKIEEMK